MTFATNAHILRDGIWANRTSNWETPHWHSVHHFWNDFAFPEFTHEEIRTHIRRRQAFAENVGIDEKGHTFRSKEVDDLFVIPTF